MQPKIYSLIVVLAAAMAGAQNIQITGVVVDTAGNPLSEASVKLAGQGLAAVTGLDGSFTLSNSAVASKGPVSQTFLLPYYRNGTLFLNLAAEEKVHLSMRDIAGRTLWSEQPTVSSGNHRISLPIRRTGSRLVVIGVDIGNRRYIFRALTVSREGSADAGGGNAGSMIFQAAGLARKGTLLDSITVFMGSYLPASVAIDSYTGNYTITLHRIPFPVSWDRMTTWNPGIRVDKQLHLPLRGDGLPDRTVIYATLKPGDNIQTAINNCPEGQVVALGAGTYTISSTLQISKGIVLRGAGSQGAPGGTTIVKTGGQTVINIGTGRDQICYGGTGYDLSADGQKESRTISVGSAASKFSAGDLALVDVADDSLVRQGDGTYFKRVSGRSASQRVEVGAVDVAKGQLTIDAPLHWNFKTTSPYLAQIVRVTSAVTRWAGVENLRVQGGTNPGYDGQMAGGIDMSNAAYCWVKDVQTDSTIGGMHVCLTATFRCVVRDGNFHHSANYGFGADCYGIVLRCGAADGLVENNIVRYMNKPIMFNVTGGGNVIAYNYADNSWATPPAWQEVNIDCHCSFPHMELIEGNEAPHEGASTTHGNAGYLTFFRNVASSQFAPPPVYGFSGAQTGNVTSLEFDGGDIGMNVVGNVLGASGVSTAYDAYTSSAYSVFELGNGGAGAADIAATSLARQGNYDYVNKKVMWYPATATAALPQSLYLAGKPAWWPSGAAWPWSGADLPAMAGTLPAKDRSRKM